MEDKSNEIPAVRRLIERFPHLDGVTVTTDAMHCLDETARLIVQEYAASQVFAVQREVIPTGKTFKASKEICYAITSTSPLADLQCNGTQLLGAFRGHWGVEAKNHYRRDITYQEDRSPVKNHNAARVLATMKMLAIFLCQIGAHQPQSDRCAYILHSRDLLCASDHELCCAQHNSSTDYPALDTHPRETHTRAIKRQRRSFHSPIPVLFARLHKR